MTDQPPDVSADAPSARPGRGRRLASATGRGVGRAGQASGSAASYVFRSARRASHASGAGESGLYRLIELHAFNAAGDAAVAISLAGTLFFASPGEARGHVALFLGLTMLPFAVIAPVIGPFLDRFAHGRRWAVGATMAVRGICCLVMADTLNTPMMYPAALGCLVSSKAYGVTRAAAVPRLLPAELPLTRANSRISLAGVVGAAVSGPLAAGAALIAPQWSLRYGFLVFVVATVLAILLPAQADATHGEEEVTLSSTPTKRKTAVPPSIVFALRSNAGLRMLSGFLTMYMAFLLRQHPLPGWQGKETLLMGLVIGAAGLGNTVGIFAGSVIKALRPAYVVTAALAADCAAAAVCAVFYGLVPAIALGLTAGVAQSLGKLSLDSLIQSEIPERVRTSTFARSETLLQLAWVIGGFIGIALPLIPRVGLGVLTGLMALWTGFVLARRPARRAARPD